MKSFLNGNERISKNSIADIKLPNDRELETIIPKINAYHKEGKVTKVILQKIEKDVVLKRKNKGVLDLIYIESKTLEIEHIFPQNPQKISDTVEKENGNENNHINQIGNLILVESEINQELSNNIFATKKETLKKFKEKGKLFISNNEILNENEWTKKQIEKRTKNIIKKIKKLYPYF
ncbi:HNH endonuclease family protein [[Mycoplasma] mobile]|uniref:GmrSD restriction endonucleases C-terminal domain-containing protein n=1 Tax=Mycoplasma mobile (strain ATCC 43663 / 163K / NCTC 11711) TaxID=267748 RepID=Q6KH32_MYCM1|nr:HNH endonuclease family protein [[Mycoplasma] mobile]AAT28099.1 hypothetical protein MMOB6130 [Mycoplasma mobile 163K]